MRFRTMLVILVLAAAAFVAAQSAGNSTPTSNAEAERELMAADAAFDQATAANGVDGWVSFMAEDAVALNPEKLVVGKAAIREEMSAQFKPGTSLRWKPSKAELISPRFGYTVGVWVAKGTRPNGEAFERTGKYLSVWRKQKDNTWKVVADGGS